MYGWKAAILTGSEDIFFAAAPGLDLQRENRFCEISQITPIARYVDLMGKLLGSRDRGSTYFWTLTVLYSMYMMHIFKPKVIC